MVLKGKNEPISCLEPYEEDRNQKADLVKYQSAFDEITMDAGKALDSFHKLARIFPDDGLVRFQYHRLKAGERGVKITLGNK